MLSSYVAWSYRHVRAQPSHLDVLNLFLVRLYSLQTSVTELALPLFDFISDILNGLRLFKDCHRIFGSLTIGLVFAPMAVFLPVFAVGFFAEDHFSGWRKVLLPFAYPVAVIVATPSYVACICFVAIRRILDIEYQGNWDGQLTGYLKFHEITLESETQLILGEHRNLRE